ncbi:MAG: hypothetical protein KC431_17620, partial [Myxococcales bacterium]|nr:hypothetical protein [Myxococcales bacterium]
SFGIGPGCKTVDPEFGFDYAVPPVRMRSVAELMSSDPLASICAADYSSFMAATVEKLVGSCGE